MYTYIYIYTYAHDLRAARVQPPRCPRREANRCVLYQGFKYNYISR